MIRPYINVLMKKSTCIAVEWQNVFYKKKRQERETYTTVLNREHGMNTQLLSSILNHKMKMKSSASLDFTRRIRHTSRLCNKRAATRCTERQS